MMFASPGYKPSCPSCEHIDRLLGVVVSAVVDEGSMMRLQFGRDDVTGAEAIQCPGAAGSGSTRVVSMPCILTCL